MLDLPVQNETDVTAIRPFGADLLELDVADPAGAARVLTRRLVLATGRDGLGGPYVPDLVRDIDKQFWAHSAEDIAFDALRGRRVGVIGAGASAMDNAATALEAGAASLDLFIRRPDIPRVNKFTGIGSPGTVHGFQALPDEWKWRFLDYVMAEQTPPPRDSTVRVSSHPNARFHLAAPIHSVRVHGNAIRARTPHGEHGLDFLILATGFAIDLARRPELAAFAPHIRLWRDRFVPPAGMDNAELEFSPDLDPAFAFQQRIDGACPHVGRIHCFNYPGDAQPRQIVGRHPGGQRRRRTAGARHRAPAVCRGSRPALRQSGRLRHARASG